MELIHNGTHFYYGCSIHRAGTERRNYQNTFYWLHKAFSVTCQTVFCRLQVKGAMTAVGKARRPLREFECVGGGVCWGLTNRVGEKRGGPTREYFNSYTDYVSWCQQADLLHESRADPLNRSAAKIR